jgi:YidC/Oxa1 family membrane protein insertase
VENRRVLLAVLLSMVVIIGWQLLFPPAKPPEAPPEAQRPRETAERPEAPAPTRSEQASEAEERTGGEAEPVAAAEERRVVLEGEGFRAELTNRGAELVSLRLPQYQDGEEGVVDLVRDRQGIAHPFGLVGADGSGLPVGDRLFAVEESTGPGGEPTAVFTYSGPEGRVTKRFAVEPNGLLGVEVEADLGEPWGIVLGPGLRNPTAREERRKFKYRGAVYLAGEKVATMAPEKAEAEEVLPGAGLAWVGLEDTYFLAALIPESPVDRVVISPWLVEVGTEAGGAPTFSPVPKGGVPEQAEDLRRELRVVVMPDGDSFSGLAYLGAKDLSRLEKLPWRLQETVRLGWFGFLARFFLRGLQWIYEHVVPNYGWAIVLMTILIKIVLLPLTHKSYMSMQKMQELAPRIKAIRNKYKGKLRDKKGRPDVEQQRKMNEEVSGLYRGEGVNPAGGCLPMILQFPVLIGFYRLLSHAIELRGAPWMLWIDDLSMHDPIYVLPIIMGAVQFLQQRMAPSVGDPMQRRMMMAMPIVFTFLFMGFPSGLVLYWLTNNLLTLIQQAVYQHLKARRTAEAEAA